MKKLFFIPLIFFFFIACETENKKAVTLYHHAKIYTVNDSFEVVQAVAVADGIFVGVGSEDELRKSFLVEKEINLEGKTIIPGLYDAHCHFYGLGLNQLVVDLVGTSGPDEILERLAQFQKEKSPDFILGRGWDQNDWEVKEFPHKEILDDAFPDTPVVLERVDGHAYWVNSLILNAAGIDENTDAQGGTILKDQNGAPTGVLVDGPMRMVDNIVPKPNRAAQISALKAAEDICLSYGLTTVNDAGLDRAIIELVDSLQQVGQLRIRMYAMVSNNPQNLEHYLNNNPYKTDRLNVRSVKVYADGALGSRGATLKKPYEDAPTHYGVMITPTEDLESLASQIHKAGYQMNTHAIGDSANVAVLRAYDGVLGNNEDLRWKVEHAQVIDHPDFDYFSKGIIPSVQPTHATSDMYWAEDRLGSERIKGAYAYKTLLSKAGKIALGTDFPVEQVSPFYTFYASVARQDLEGYPKEGFRIQEALSREETLKGMTIWAAYSNFEENERGSIEVGKMADFIVMDQDPMIIPMDSIPAIKPKKVFIAGSQVYAQ